MKVHYIGYSEDFDEWKNEEELENFEDQNDETTAVSPYQPFSII